MGTIANKLYYLSNSKDILVRYIKRLGYKYENDMTLREIIELLNGGYKKIEDDSLVLDLVLTDGTKVIDTVSGNDYTEYCTITEDGFTIKTSFFSMDASEFTLIGYSPCLSENFGEKGFGLPGASIYSNYYNYLNTSIENNRLISEPCIMSNHARNNTQYPYKVGDILPVSLSKQSGAYIRTSIEDFVYENESDEEFSEYTLPVTKSALYDLPLYYHELYLYNKYLSKEDLLKCVYSYYRDIYNECVGIYDGIKGLGPMMLFRQTNENNEFFSFVDIEASGKTEGTHTQNGRIYKNDTVELEEPLANYDEFESVHFYNFPEELYLGREECISAFVYPMDIQNKFEIEYSTNNDSICDNVGSVFIPKALGSVTITAKIRGTEISTSKEIEIKEAPTLKEIIYEVDLPSDSDMSPSETMQWIQDQVTNAHNIGCTVCRFPEKETFHIVPISASGYEIPNNMIIDFNYSTLYIDDGHEFVTSNYILFDLNEGQEFSGIRNLILYGERLNDPSKVGQDIYTEGNCWYRIQNCKWCILENVYTRYTCGFDVSLGGYSQFRSTPDFNTKGVVDYTYFQMGKILSNGIVEDRDDWITTNRKIPVIDKEYTDGNFRMGTYTSQIGVIGARLYNILWYDEDQMPIAYYENCIQNEPYPLKDGFKYFDITFNTSILPSHNNTGGDDYNAIRMLQSRSTTLFTIRNFVSLDNYSGAFSVVGQLDRLMVDGLFTFSWEKRKNGWDIDFEDGWLNMRKYVIKNTFARLVYFSGDSGAYINSYAKTISIRSDMSSFKLANSWIKKIYLLNDGARLSNEIIGVVTGTNLDALNPKDYSTYVIGNRRTELKRNGNALNSYHGIER